MTTQVRRHPRRTLALAAGLLALAAPVLSACGSFDYATERPNILANGGYSLDTNIRVNAARIVTGEPGSGSFIATFALSPTVNPAGGSQTPSFTGLQTADGASSTVQTDGPVDIPISDDGMVNLSDPGKPTNGGVPVTGDFKPGDMVPLTLSFSSGQDPITVQVPVVTRCGAYASVGPAPRSSAPAQGDQSTDPYACDYPPATLPSE